MSSTKVYFAVLVLALFAGVAVNAEVTECEDIDKKRACRKADDKYDLDCYWNPMTKMCVDAPTECADIADKTFCNQAMKRLNTTDNCLWDSEESECMIPTECSDLDTENRCDNFEMYPDLDVTANVTECKYNKKSGCYQYVYPTSCDEITSAKKCKNSFDRYGLECFYVAKECIEPPTTCDEIPTKNMCTTAIDKLGFPCFFQNGTCIEAPTTCDEISSKNKCESAYGDLGLVGCSWGEDMCNTFASCSELETRSVCRNAADMGLSGCSWVFAEEDDEEDACDDIICEDIVNKNMCESAQEKFLLDCYFDKPSKACTSL